MFRNIFSKIFKKKKTKSSFNSIGKEKYNFDFQVEKDIYQNLCCNRVKKKVIEMLEQKNLKFYTYSEWKQYIYNKYKNCNRAQLLEFSRYLNQGIRNTEPDGKYWELIIPVIMTLALTNLFAYILNFFVDTKWNFSGVNILGAFLIVIVVELIVIAPIMLLIILLVLKTIKPIFNVFTDKSFFTDYKEIIDEMIKEKKG